MKNKRWYLDDMPHVKQVFMDPVPKQLKYSAITVFKRMYLAGKGSKRTDSQPEVTIESLAEKVRNHLSTRSSSRSIC